MVPLSFGNKVKRPNVSGQFYSGDPTQLSHQIQSFIEKASIEPSQESIEILISPHAGYIYSGWVAAYGYKAISQKKYDTIVVISPTHHFGFDGISVWDGGRFQTPLGLLEVDHNFAKELIHSNKKIIFKPEVFEKEHALEVQLPFLQEIYEDIKIVPIIMGQCSFALCEEFAKILNKLMESRGNVLIVISSDMSHYHDDAFARNMDQNTLKIVQQLKAQYFWEQCFSNKMEMCGVVPVTVGLLLAKERNLESKVLKYATSAEVSGDKQRVVGYSSVIFYNPIDKENKQDPNKVDNASGVDPLSMEQKQRLMHIAKETIIQYIKTGKAPSFEETDPRLLVKEGAFVTIHKKGQLRGCIGNIIGVKPLYQTIREMAISSATRDPRFTPLTTSELDKIDIEISVLSKPRQETDIKKIKMGVHGVIVSKGFLHQGVFLPQVATETGWNREQFLSNLCAHKAGLPSDAWKDPSIKIEIFTADVFSEEDVKE